MPDLSSLAQIFLQAITLTFMLVGWVGLLIPIFPGIAIIWLAALFYAIAQTLMGAMDVWDWILFVLITVLAIFGSVVDNIIIAKKVHETGTPWKSIFLAYAVGIVGSLFLTPLIGLLLTPLAMFLIEWRRLGDRTVALQSTRGFLIGFGWTLLALLAIGAVMIVLWMLWAWL
jgi:uncharacterized protein